MSKLKKTLRILTIIDPHGADKNPGARVDNYREAFFKKLDEISLLVKKHKVDVVVVTGDIFSSKEKLRNSHTLTSVISEKFLNIGCDVVGVLGNHDLYQDRLSSWEEQPIAVLIRTKSIKLLDNSPIFYELEGGFRVCLRGQSYTTYDNDKHFFAPRGDEDLLIHVSHSAVCPSGGIYDKYGEKMLSYKELSKSSPDIFILGHIHTDYGITEEFGKVFVQNGSLMRSTTHCYNLERDVKVGLLEITKDKVKTKELKLTVEDHSVIFDLELKKKIEEETAKLESLLVSLDGTLDDAIIKSDSESLNIEELFLEIEEEGITSKELLSKYRHYMSEAKNVKDNTRKA